MKFGSILWEVLRSLFHKPATIRQLAKTGEIGSVSERYRGKIIYLKEACVGCLLCIRTCPGGAITATEAKKISINLSCCIFCGQCVEMCPKEALRFGSDFDIIVQEKRDLVVQ